MNTNDALSGEKKVIVLVVVLFVNLILISGHIGQPNDRSLLRNVLANVISPFQVGFQKMSDYVVDRVNRYAFLKGVVKKYQKVKVDNVELRRENYWLKREIQNQEFLVKSRNLREQFVIAEVISIDSVFPFNQIVVNRGSSSGVSERWIVLNGDGALVGRIIQPITLLSANVQLITSFQCAVGAYLEKNRLEGFIKGNNSALCNFNYIYVSEKIDVGDRIVTSGTDMLFPPELPLGEVTRVEKDYLVQHIWVEPYFIKKSMKKLILIPNEATN